MSTAIHRQVEACQRGESPHLIAQMRSGWAVIAEKQVVRGYCLLLPDPVVGDLNALPPESRVHFLSDMAMLGDALLDVTGAARINYEMLGNLEPALHAHVIPRYDDEPDEVRHKPIWMYDFAAAPAYTPDEHRGLVDELIDALRQLDALID